MELIFSFIDEIIKYINQKKDIMTEFDNLYIDLNDFTFSLSSEKIVYPTLTINCKEFLLSFETQNFVDQVEESKSGLYSDRQLLNTKNQAILENLGLPLDFIIMKHFKPFFNIAKLCYLYYYHFEIDRSTLLENIDHNGHEDNDNIFELFRKLLEKYGFDELIKILNYHLKMETKIKDLSLKNISTAQLNAVVKRNLGIALNSSERSHLSKLRKKLREYILFTKTVSPLINI